MAGGTGTRPTTRFVRPAGLRLLFSDEDALVAHAPGFGRAVRAPAPAASVIAFCGEPRTADDVERALGPAARGLFEGLVRAGLLVEPEHAADTPVLFEGFARVDVHRRMLGDLPRLEAYRRALEAAVRPGSVVLDAGTGTGVLAVMAARAGARRVYAVDRSGFVDLARRVVSDSGLEGVVRVLRGDFARIELPERVDLVVTETFGALALAEGAAADLRACADRLLAEGGRIVPAALSLHLAPVAHRELHAAAVGVFSDAWGADLRAVRALALREGWTAPVPPGGLLHPGAPLLRLPVTVGEGEGGARLEGVRPGRVLGLAGWFTLHLAPGVDLPTGPLDRPTHWRQVYLPLPDEPPLVVGDDGRLELDLAVGPDAADPRATVATVSWRAASGEGRWSWRVR